MKIIQIKSNFWALIITIITSTLVACSSTTVSTNNSNTSNNSSSKKNSFPDKKLIAANANIQLGMNYLQKGNVTVAKQKLLLALELSPKYPAAWYTMAYFFEATGDIQKADEYYREAIALNPSSGDALNNYGTFLCHTGKAKESIPYFLDAIKDSNYVDTSAAYENAGLCALRIPDINAAKTYFSKAVQRDPQRTRSLFELAAINYHQGNYAAASDLLSQIVIIGKPSPAALALAAKTANKLGEKNKAQQYISQLKQQFPTSREAKAM